MSLATHPNPHGAQAKQTSPLTSQGATVARIPSYVMPWSPFSPPRARASCSPGLSSKTSRMQPSQQGGHHQLPPLPPRCWPPRCPTGAHGRLSQPAVTDTSAALRARHADEW